MKKKKYRCGFVSILGRPNAGKSTLLNAFLGSKLAIVASKPQTTRTAIQGVLTLPEAQIVFIDTPGIHKSDSMINHRMMETVRASAADRDLALFVADATATPNDEDKQAVDVLQRVESPVILVLNKIDRLEDKAEMLPRLQRYQELYPFAALISVSAAKSQGLDVLREEIVKRLPEGDAIFPDDYLTDQPERFIAAELIRERILQHTQQEVPHSVAVLIEKWETTPKLTRISAAIYVEKAGQKKIIIGAAGSLLKKIGTEARLAIEQLIDGKVFLELFVKVKPGWREDPAFLNEIDWRSMTGV